MANLLSAPKHILIGHGDKGGVGKSLFTRLLLQYHLDRNIGVDAYDSDDKVGDLKRFYKEKVEACSLTNAASIGPVLDRLMDAPDAPNTALIDVAGGRGEDIATWLSRSQAINAAEAGHLGIVIFFLIGSTASSLALLKDNMKSLGAKVGWVVVQNHFFTQSFDHYKNDVELQKLLGEVDAYEYALSALDQVVAQRLDRNGWTFDEARLHLPFTQRGYLKTWLEDQYKILDELSPMIGVRQRNEPVVTSLQGPVPAAANG